MDDILNSLFHKTVFWVLLVRNAIYYFRKSIDKNLSPGELDKAQISIATAEGQQGDIFFQQGKNKDAIARYMSSLEHNIEVLFELSPLPIHYFLYKIS